MNTSSKLHPKFQAGVLVISGLWGLGKSTLAFTAERPDQTAILDFGGEQIVRDYGIRHYACPNTVGSDPADYDVRLLAARLPAGRFVEQVQAIPAGITSLVLDNATWVEAGLGRVASSRRIPASTACGGRTPTA